MADIAIFDVDGTLVDTNYHHTIAWHRAFRRHDITLPLWRIHRAIGMGGDQLVPNLAGEQVEKEHGSEIREAWTEEYDAIIPEVQLFEGARVLLQDIKDRGFRVVLASSGKGHQVDHYLDLLDARELTHDWTTSADVEATKPAPDLVHAALAKAGADDGAGAVMLGDSTWDFVAAGRAGVAGIGLMTGGFSPEELKAAGAAVVFESLGELLDSLDETPLG